jgi:Mrp family chromosome partitioning ATPase
MAQDVQNSDSKLMQRINIPHVTTRPSTWRAAIKWRWRTIVAWTIVGLVASILMLWIEQRRHVVTGELLLPPIETSAAASPSDGLRETFIEAQIETIKSDLVIAATLDKLSMWKGIDSASSEADNSSEHAAYGAMSDAERLRAISKVKDLLTVSPFASGSSVVITLASQNPDGAAKFVNALLDSYVDDYEKTVKDAPKQAVNVLEQRLDTLQDRATTAEEQARSGSGSTKERQKLEAAASTYRSLHQQTLSQYADALNAAQPVSSGPKVLARASAVRTSPATSTAMLLGTILSGSLIGFAVAFRREQKLRPVRTLESLEADTGLPVLGVVSLVHGRKLYPKNGAEPPLLLHDDKDNLRSVLLRLRENFSNGSCVVGVASTLDAEGKSTLAFNLAVLGVEGGSRVLLLDGNLHRPALARGLTSEAAPDLLGVLKDPSDLVRNVVPTEFGFNLLGAQDASDDVRPAVLFSSPGLTRLIAGARENYDLIICDLPALANHADAQAAAASLDVCVLVVEWGQTSTTALIRAVKASPAVGRRTAGIIINKAPQEVLRSA